MKIAKLIRSSSCAQGTKGKLTFENFECDTLELQDLNNKPFVSCIPAGTYVCKPYPSSKWGMVWRLLKVPQRTDILIHRGNWAGQETKGYKSDVLGCILVGKGFTTDINISPNGQLMILNSKKTLLDFMQVTKQEKQLTIKIVDEY